MKKESKYNLILLYGSAAAALLGVLYFNNHEEKLEKQIAQEVLVRDSLNAKVVEINDSVKTNNLGQILADLNSFKNYLNRLDSAFNKIATKKYITKKDSLEQESLQLRIQYGLNKLRQAEKYGQRMLRTLEQRDSVERKIDSLYTKKWIK